MINDILKDSLLKFYIIEIMQRSFSKEITRVIAASLGNVSRVESIWLVFLIFVAEFLSSQK